MRHAYYRMVGRWREIVDRPNSREVKQAECLSLLRDYIDGIAWARMRGPNRPLQFYADMLVLQELLKPTFATDELGEVAIRPAYALVRDWLDEHKSA